MMTSQFRRQTASTLVIILLTVCLLIVPLLVVIGQMGLYSVDRARVQNIIEAAGLLAANNASKIKINDPVFGYVSLSNYPPIGKETRAADGEPLPVIGINTLVGTIRQNTIIAHEIGNKTIDALAQSDRSSMQSTIAQLNSALRKSMAPDPQGQFIDIHGDKVDTVKDVTAFLTKALPHNVRLVSVQLTNGWLTNGGRTTIPISQPERLAQLKPGDAQLGEYKPFIDLPVANRSFSFAGVGTSSTLVSPSAFREADGRHINSIVKLDCVLAVNNACQRMLPFGGESLSTFRCVACCQPYSLPDVGPPGVMMVRFSGEPAAGLQSWSDFLREFNFRDRQVSTYDAVGGDFPLDQSARMQPFHPELQSANGDGTLQIDSSSGQFAQHLYNWLRNGRLRPRIDAVLAMLDEPFRAGSNQTYAYEFARDGTISRRVLARDPFPIGVTADAQTSTVVDTRIADGLAPVIIFKDNVRHLGSLSGGKHSGQPLPGAPLDWCERSEYSGDEQSAKALGKGRQGTGLTLVNSSGAALPPLAFNNATDSNAFQAANGKALLLQPRRSYYSGGLAVDIEIGGTRKSTAWIDVERMRRLKR